MILTPAAMDRLMSYDWPGNVRELENVIERAVVLCGDREIDVDLIPDHVSADPVFEVPDAVIPPEGIHFREVIIGHERRYIEAALEAAGGVQKKAAELLHIKATTLNEMIKRYDIRPRRRKGSGDARDDETLEPEGAGETSGG
jgi:DNA-binding NtrC family response regulator